MRLALLLILVVVLGCGDVTEGICASCDENATCVSDAEAERCECNAGYEGDGLSCTDIDECAEGTDSCDENAICTNIPGSYECECVDGYEGDGTTCSDIDECERGTHDCDENAVCINVRGSFECACVDGYEGDGVVCTEVDPCADGTHDCGFGASCIPDAGDYTCECNPSFEGDGTTCTPRAVVVYDFEHLEAGEDLDGQDGWVASPSQGNSAFVAAGSTPENATLVATIGLTSNQGLTRINDGEFSFAAFTGQERDAYIQADVRPRNENATSLRIGTGEMSFAESVAIRLQDDHFGFDNVNIGPRASREAIGAGEQDDWYRFRLVMDFGAGAAGTGTLLYKNLTRGDEAFTEVVSGSLDIDTLAVGAEVTEWDTISVFISTGAEWDNLTIGRGE